MVRRRPSLAISRSRAALFGLLVAGAAALLVVPFAPAGDSVREGERAPRTLQAVNDAQYESAVLTQAARDEAARQVEAVLLPPDPAVRVAQLDRLEKLLEQVGVIRQRPDLVNAQQKLAELNNLPNAADLNPTARSAIVALDRVAFESFQQRVRTLLGEILQKPVARGQVDTLVAQALAQPENAGGSATEITALRETLRGFVAPNVSVDEQATARKRDDARAHVSPVIATYTRGQVIASEGQLLDAATIEALRATGVIGSGFDYYRAAGGGLFALGLGLLLAAYLFVFQPLPDRAGRRLALVGAVIFATLAVVRLGVPQLLPDTDHRYLVFALPVAVAAILAASFADLPFAVVVAAGGGLFGAFIAAAVPDLAGSSFTGTTQALQLGTAYAAGGLAGALAVARAERLARYLVAGVAVALATGLVLGAFWLISTPRANESLGWIALSAGVGGITAGVLGAGLFVVLSFSFGVTTRLHLMELTQGGHPLLRRLQDEAPGTYHHSMMVGALAERAADGIGADGLLARAGAYYHDAGKLARPRYYIENMIEGDASPHDGLPPEESAAIIREHVAAGLEIAARYRLPAAIRDFIPQHHGTRLVTYFYRRAVQHGGGVEAGPFRYAGPRPQSRETAIVMLADSCEAIGRAGADKSGAGIDDLVDGVFAERLAEGQLDDCDLTMRELQAVAASFKATLKAVYHPRIAYPQPGPEELARLAQS
ncbi:MAG: HDIG domain-containing protein [Dehalococcoidia bacterium]|nr:HDIG domain-containing protein [Dehalococcoidia bacterium]